MSSAAIGESSIVGMLGNEEVANDGWHGIEATRLFTVIAGPTRHTVKSRLGCPRFVLYVSRAYGCL